MALGTPTAQQVVDLNFRDWDRSNPGTIKPVTIINTLGDEDAIVATGFGYKTSPNPLVATGNIVQQLDYNQATFFCKGFEARPEQGKALKF